MPPYEHYEDNLYVCMYKRPTVLLALSFHSLDEPGTLLASLSCFWGAVFVETILAFLSCWEGLGLYIEFEAFISSICLCVIG